MGMGHRHGAGMGVHGAPPGAAAGRSMSMSIEHDLPRRQDTQCLSALRASGFTLYGTCEFSQSWCWAAGLPGLLAPSCAPPHTDVQSSGCKTAPSHSPSHPELTIARDQASILSTSPPAHPGQQGVQDAQDRAAEQYALDWTEPCNATRQGISPHPLVARRPANNIAGDRLTDC